MMKKSSNNTTRDLKRVKFETNLAIVTLTGFIFLALINSLFAITSLQQFLFSVILYSILGVGTFVTYHYAKSLGRYNFAGKGLIFMTIAFAGGLVSHLFIDYKLFFADPSHYSLFSDILWLVSLCASIVGMYALLMPVHLNIDKTKVYQTGLLFLIFFIGLIFIFGWPTSENGIYAQILTVLFTIIDALLLSMSILIIRLIKSSTVWGLSLFVVGILLLLLVKEFSLLNTITSENEMKNMIEMIPGPLTIIGWILMVLGTYNIGRMFTETKDI